MIMNRRRSPFTTYLIGWYISIWAMLGQSCPDPQSCQDHYLKSPSKLGLPRIHHKVNKRSHSQLSAHNVWAPRLAFTDFWWCSRSSVSHIDTFVHNQAFPLYNSPVGRSQLIFAFFPPLSSRVLANQLRRRYRTDRDCSRSDLSATYLWSACTYLTCND